MRTDAGIFEKPLQALSRGAMVVQTSRDRSRRMHHLFTFQYSIVDISG